MVKPHSSKVTLRGGAIEVYMDEGYVQQTLKEQTRSLQGQTNESMMWLRHLVSHPEGTQHYRHMIPHRMQLHSDGPVKRRTADSAADIDQGKQPELMQEKEQEANHKAAETRWEDPAARWAARWPARWPAKWWQARAGATSKSGRSVSRPHCPSQSKACGQMWSSSSGSQIQFSANISADQGIGVNRAIVGEQDHDRKMY